MSEKKEEIGFEEAMKQLAAILEKLEGDESDLDKLTARVKEASELVKLCKERIQKTEMEVTRILEELPEEDEAV